METAIRRVDTLLEPFKPSFFREIIDEDLVRLWEIKMARILKFNSAKADEKNSKGLMLKSAVSPHDMESISTIPRRNGISILKGEIWRPLPETHHPSGRSIPIEAAKVAGGQQTAVFRRRRRFYRYDIEKTTISSFPCSDIDDILEDSPRRHI